MARESSVEGAFCGRLWAHKVQVSEQDTSRESSRR